MHYLIWQRQLATGFARGVRPRHFDDIDVTRRGAAQVPAMTPGTAA
jgi:hypothetical protein